MTGPDPDGSPAHAAIRVRRVAGARGVDPDAVRALVDDATSGRDLGSIGAPHVRVPGLDLALDRGFGRV
ncbi:potassium-transporting ATPase subunit C [Geodermatophilus normandii]|uniref:potassium-transporting ATPase subunit C n=1 Tax=Geodermatophilus normandii TaxID=1137989 RepID=UPI001FE391DC|nr:potassium-transporting ATPase subunit C [Geodermatophilus normandii]